MTQETSPTQIRDVCDAFEKQRESGKPPELPPWLNKVDGSLQAGLLVQLAKIDVKHRRRLDPDFSAEEFLENHGLSTADLHDATLSLRDPRLDTTILTPARTLRASERLGKYEVESEAGRGGFGVVYRVFDTGLKRFVALKTPRDSMDAVSRKRFLREAEAAASLDHPGLVTVFESGEIDGVCYIATAFCSGPNLAQWVQQQDRIPHTQAAHIVKKLAEAMQHAHDRGIVHRDLKPGNVMLVPASDTGACDVQPRITDFGLAKLIDDRLADTGSGVALGTPNYMAPEQLAADGDSSPAAAAADIYALGVILYELLAGVKPFERDTVLEVMTAIQTADLRPPSAECSDIPPDLETICLKAMSKDPADRYDSCATLAQDLSRFLNNEPILARRPTIGDRLRRWSRSTARRSEAGMLSMVLGLGMPFWMIMITVIVWWEGLKVQISSEIVPQTLVLSVLLMLPLAWVGYKTRSGHRLWTKIGFWSSIVNTAMVCAPLCGYVVIFPELYKQFPLGKIVVFTILTLVFGVQTFQYGVLMYASNRRSKAN